RRITLADIVRVILDMEAHSDPAEAEDGSPLGTVVVRPLWRELSEECMGQLEAVTIQDLCNRAREAGIESEDNERLDYTI
ncbi:MAG: transcriptional regulator, partial [Alphaproteobacteria bacterium]